MESNEWHGWGVPLSTVNIASGPLGELEKEREKKEKRKIEKKRHQDPQRGRDWVVFRLLGPPGSPPVPSFRLSTSGAGCVWGIGRIGLARLLSSSCFFLWDEDRQMNDLDKKELWQTPSWKSLYYAQLEWSMDSFRALDTWRRMSRRRFVASSSTKTIFFFLRHFIFCYIFRVVGWLSQILYI